jgi:hypothetical protein
MFATCGRFPWKDSISENGRGTLLEEKKKER